MNKLFNIKRTKMIDEAAKGHNPNAFGRIFLAVFLVYIISNAITNLITTVPTTIYYLILAMQDGTYAEIESAMLSGNASLATSLIYGMMTHVPWWAILLQLFGGGALFGAVIFYWKKFEKRKIASLGIRRGLIPLELLYGILIGGALASIMLLISHFSGSLAFTSNGFSIALLLFPFGFFIFAAGEEILIHGLLMTSLARDIKPVFAVLISSLVFSLLGFSYTLDITYFLNTFLFNFLLGAFVLKRGNLWGSIMAKATWGFLSANILGMGACGFSPMISILKPHYGSAQIITGSSDYGFESSLILTLLLIISIALVLLLKTKKTEKSVIEIEYFK